MLSSAQKSVPTTKQFRQPYFIDIAPDGAILSTCSRFAALLKKRDIPEFLGNSFQDIFSRLGKLDAPIPADLSLHGLPKTIELSIQWPEAKSFVIRWIPTPRYTIDAHAGGWQLTGIKVYPAPQPTLLPAEISERRRSDIIVTTDMEDRIVYWNKAAELFYDIPSQ